MFFLELRRRVAEDFRSVSVSNHLHSVVNFGDRQAFVNHFLVVVYEAHFAHIPRIVVVLGVCKQIFARVVFHTLALVAEKACLLRVLSQRVEISPLCLA